jgi:tRNA(Ile)-lysidine synthase
MLRQVERTILERRLIPRRARVLVAVSGGADSIALLHALHFLRRRHGWALTVAHLHHGIRGRAADLDEQFVQRAAWRLGLACVTARADVPALAKRSGRSLEMAGREARYRFLEAAAREHGIAVVATAHTADDQAETILLRLLRGAGPQGLAGIPYETRRHGIRIVRPLRDVERRDLVAFLRRHRIRWREDRSNRDPRILRNRVRHVVLPFLERRLNPRARAALRRAGELIGEESRWLDGQARRRLRRCLDARNPARLDASRLAGQPAALRRRILRLWLASRGVEPGLLDLAVTDALDRLASSRAGTSARTVDARRRVVRAYGTLAMDAAQAAKPPAFRTRLAVPGVTRVPPLGLVAEARATRGYRVGRAGCPGALPDRASLDAGRVGRKALYLRSWRPGDRMRPLGMKGARKLQDVFVDAKVPRETRSRIPILECGGEIVWVPGYRIAADWALRSPRAASITVSLRPV